MSEILIALVAVPMVAAVVPLALAPVTTRSGWWLTLGTLLVHAALAASLTALVAGAPGNRVSLVVGGFALPYGIELVADGISTPFVVLVSGVSLALLAYTRRGGPRSNPFYSLYLLLVAGLTGVCVTGDAFNLYVFLEISGLAAYALVASGRGGRAALAALQYLLLGTVGATLYLLGIGYAYVATGTLNMADLAVHLPHDSTLALAAFACIVAGLAVKLALFPLHVWQPDAYEHAPYGVSALLSALVSTVAGYALLRLVFGVFTIDFLTTHPLIPLALQVLGAGSVAAGGILAFRAASVRRVFAYSSVAQFGLATLGIGIATIPAVVGAIIQLLSHAVMKGGLFAAAGVVEARTDAATMADYRGHSVNTPRGSASIAVIGLGMIGLPPTVGFVAKWYLAVGALEAHAWGSLVVVLASTLVSLTYFGRLIQDLYTTPADGATDASTPTRDGVGGASLGMRSVATGAAVATVVLGVLAAGIASFVEPTVTTILHP